MSDDWKYRLSIRQNLPYILQHSIGCQVARLVTLMYSKFHITEYEKCEIHKTRTIELMHSMLYDCLLHLRKRNRFKGIYDDLMVFLDDDTQRKDIPERIRETLQKWKHVKREPQETTPSCIETDICHEYLGDMSVQKSVTYLDSYFWGEEQRTGGQCGTDTIDGVSTEGHINNSALFRACVIGDDLTVSDILSSTPNDDIINSSKTPLMVACDGDSPSVISALVKSPSLDVNKRDDNGLTAFLYACRNGDPAIMSALLEHEGVDCNVMDKNGVKAVWYMFLGRYVNKLLCDKNELKDYTKNGRCVIRYMVERLRERSTEINWENVTEIVRLLLDDSRMHKESMLEVTLFIGDATITDLILQTVQFDLTQERYIKLILSAIISNDSDVLSLFLKKTSLYFSKLDSRQLSDIMKYAIFMNNYRITKVLQNANRCVVLEEAVTVLMDLQARDKTRVKGFDNFVMPTFNFNIRDGDKNTAFMLACELCDYNSVEFLLQQDPKTVDFHAVNTKGQDAFKLSCFNYDKNVTTLLANCGKYDLRKTDKNGESGFVYARKTKVHEVTELLTTNINDKYCAPALSKACNEGNLNIVTDVLNRNVTDIDTKDSNDLTYLMRACDNGHTDIVSELLTHKADVNLQNDNKTTALMFASCGGYEDVVSVLLESLDLDVNAQDADGLTSLMYACMKEHSKVATLLMKHTDTDINKADNHGDTALSYACEFSPTIAPIIIGRNDTEINAVNNDDETALMKCSTDINTKLLSHLLSRSDMQVNLKDKNSCTALIQSSKDGSTEAMKLLLDRDDIETDCEDMNGKTALTWASLKGYGDAVKLLLSRADVNFVNSSGWTSLLWACLHGTPDIVSLFLDNEHLDVNRVEECGMTAFMSACLKRKVPVALALLSHPNIDVNVADSDGKTALMMSCVTGCDEVVSLLLKNSKTNINAVDRSGRTALMITSDSYRIKFTKRLLADQQKKLVSLLLDHEGIDVSISDSDGKNVLMLACEKDNKDLVWQLLQYETVHETVNHQDNNGRTALMLASMNGWRDIVAMLLESDSIDMNVRDNKRKTAYKLARRNDHDDIANMLVEKGARVKNRTWYNKLFKSTR